MCHEYPTGRTKWLRKPQTETVSFSEELNAPEEKYREPVEDYRAPLQENTAPAEEEYGETPEESAAADLSFTEPIQEYNKAPEQEIREPVEDFSEPEYKEPVHEFSSAEPDFSEPVQEYKATEQEIREPVQDYSEPEYKEPAREFSNAEPDFSESIQEYKAPEQEYREPENTESQQHDIIAGQNDAESINTEGAIHHPPSTINEEYQDPEITINEEFAEARESRPTVNQELTEDPQPVITVNEEYAQEEADIPTVNQEFAAETDREAFDRPSHPFPEPTAVAADEAVKPQLAFDAKKAESIVFAPYHMIDYFASQGIKLVLEDNPPDQFRKAAEEFYRLAESDEKATSEAADRPKKQMKREAERIRHFAAHSIEERDILTESMAEVLAKQGMYENAIALYQKLSLIYPPKSAYFASRIEQLKASLP